MLNTSKPAINRQQLFQIQAYARQHALKLINADRRPHHILETLNKIIYLCFLRHKDRKGQVFYCTPSMNWLGSQCGRSDETAQRIIQYLVNNSLLIKFTRRKTHKGKWQTNAYYPGKILGQIIGRVLGLKKPAPQPSVIHDQQINSTTNNDKRTEAVEEFVSKIRSLNALLKRKEVI